MEKKVAKKVAKKKVAKKKGNVAVARARAIKREREVKFTHDEIQAVLDASFAQDGNDASKDNRFRVFLKNLFGIK